MKKFISFTILVLSMATCYGQTVKYTYEDSVAITNRRNDSLDRAAYYQQQASMHGLCRQFCDNDLNIVTMSLEKFMLHYLNMKPKPGFGVKLTGGKWIYQATYVDQYTTDEKPLLYDVKFFMNLRADEMDHNFYIKDATITGKFYRVAEFFCVYWPDLIFFDEMKRSPQTLAETFFFRDLATFTYDPATNQAKIVITQNITQIEPGK